MIVNGKQRDFPIGITINELIRKLDVYKTVTVVIVDGEIIYEEDYDRKLDCSSDVKILTIIGGG